MEGLTTKEVEERRSKGLVNDTEVKTSRSYADIIYRNAVTPFNIILFIIGAALLALGNLVSALSATGIITINVIISTIQEMRAKHRLDKISLLTRPKVTVVRDGKEIQIDQKDIVQDDLVIIRAGEQALVDGDLLKCTSLEMDEALLTGESTTVRKNAGDKIYSGSVCITGEGYFIVTAFGHESYASQMLSSAKKFTSKKTPLQMETQTFTTILMVMAFVLMILSVIREVIRGMTLSGLGDLDSILEIFILCLDIVPIGLFLLITLTYMIAAIRMADSGVLLQRFNSVESISHVDTVCMDKTGTITTNNLVFDSAHNIADDSEADLCISLFASMTGSKNKTMTALINHYGKTEGELIDEIQFSSARKFSAVKVRYEGRVYTLYSGAWNVLEPHCDQADRIGGIITEESEKGFRTLVICSCDDIPFMKGEEYVIGDLKPISVISIRDEVRADCRETIDIFLQNGMELKVISGDDPVTVDALFRLANLPGERRIISGPELDKLPDEQLDDVILKTNIFGRMKPENKEKVIEVLKRNNRYVAMIGDGVNDVKPIKSAQVGVALESGSGAARGVADMILVNDNFSALPKALIEGRRTVSGVRDILKVYLSRNLVLAIMFIVLYLFIGRIPMLPIQNSFYAFMSVSVVAFFMTIFAKPDNNKELILPDVLRFIIPSALTIGTCSLLVYGFVYMFTMNGIIPPMSYDYLIPLQDVLGKNVQEIVETFLVWSSDAPYDALSTKAEIVARSSMVLFATCIGTLQLLIVCPRYKFLSVNGETNKRILPIILVVLVLLAIAAMYTFVPAIATILGMAMLPPEIFFVVVTLTVVAFFLIIFLVKREILGKLVDRVEKKYLEKLQKEYTKGDVVNVGEDK